MTDYRPMIFDGERAKPLVAGDRMMIRDASGNSVSLDMGAQTLARTVSIPVLTGNATLAVLSEAQTFTGAKTFTGGVVVSTVSISVTDVNVVLGTSTGTKFGTAASQKLSFYNSTPIVQPSGDVITALSNLGLVATPSISATALTGIVPSANGGTGVNNAGTITNASNTIITGGGTLALGGFTLTVPATGSAALLGTANTFTQINTFTKVIFGAGSFSAGIPSAYTAATTGLTFVGVAGSTNDISFATPSGNFFLVNPTGTNDVSTAGAFMFSGVRAYLAGSFHKSSTSGSVMSAIAGSSYDLCLKGVTNVNILQVPTGTTRTEFADTTDSSSPTTGSVSVAGGISFGATKSLFGGGIKSVSATLGIGYATGAGGAVTQGTSRTTGVTLNTVCGAITLFSAAGSATPATFTVTNSAVAAADAVRVHQKSGTDLYHVLVTAVAAGSFNVTFFTTGGTTTEQPVFTFAVIKAATS